MAWLLKRYPLQRITIAVFGAVIGISAWRWGLRFYGASPERIFLGLDARADELLSGALLALVVSCAPRRTLRGYVLRVPGLGMAGLAGLGLAAYFAVLWSGWAAFLWQPFTILMTLMIILDVLFNPDGWAARLLSCRLPVYIGSISYGIYLWHDVLNWAVLTSPYADSRLAIAVIGGCGGIFLAMISYHAIERPILGLKSRLQFPVPGAIVLATPSGVPTAAVSTHSASS